MIEHEVLEIVNNSINQGDRLNSLADQFRNGRNVNDILPLLESNNQELIEIGAWIAGEVQIDKIGAKSVITALHKLLDHKASIIRAQALTAIYSVLDANNPDTKLLLKKMRNDTNEGVRSIAIAAENRLRRGG